MKLLYLFLLASSILSADWKAIQRIPAAQRIEITASDGATTRGQVVSASEEAMVVRLDSGEQSVERSQISRVRVSDPGRRTRRGLLGLAIGGAGGYGAASVAVCPSCANEGVGAKSASRGVAIGAAIGALGFLASPSRTVYRIR